MSGFDQRPFRNPMMEQVFKNLGRDRPAQNAASENKPPKFLRQGRSAPDPTPRGEISPDFLRHTGAAFDLYPVRRHFHVDRRKVEDLTLFVRRYFTRPSEEPHCWQLSPYKFQSDPDAHTALRSGLDAQVDPHWAFDLAFSDFPFVSVYHNHHWKGVYCSSSRSLEKLNLINVL
ncbi:MAG: hypothetical protein IPL83_16100 [Bdellovibrionales bacterium]|nr:hypothetical protein [Bdellovibrionales bacterium]